MGSFELQSLLRDWRLSAQAVSASPAWLWSIDATRVLWANPTAAAIFGACSAAALSTQTFEATNSAAAQIARIGATLTDGGAARMERLRGFGAGFGRALTCLCSRITLRDGTPAILVVSTERAGPDLSLDERARRLLDGNEQPMAIFAGDGRLIHATAVARERMGTAGDLAALGAEALVAQARDGGQPQGDTTAGRLTIQRLGSGAATVLLGRFEALAEPSAPATPVIDAPPATQPQAEPPMVATEDVPPAVAEQEAQLPPVAAIEETPARADAPATTVEDTPTAPEQPEVELPPIAVEETPTEFAPPGAAVENTSPEPRQLEAELPLIAAEETPIEIEAPATVAEVTPPEPEQPAAEPPPVAVDRPPVVSEPPPPKPQPPAQPESAIVTFAERRHPLRFVWLMDAAGAFTIGSEEFTQLIGPNTASVLGQPWSRIAEELRIDENGAIAKALSSHDTWSGIVVPWPVDGSDERLPIELSGLPVFDRDRTFRGYRGFGVCRDVARLSALAIARSLAPPVPMMETPAAPVAEPAEPRVIVTPPEPGEPEPPAQNVLPFRSPTAKNGEDADQPPALSPGESTAFNEIGRRLSDRLKAAAAMPPSSEPPLEEESEAAPPRPRGELKAEVERTVLDRLPVGILVYRLNDLLYANRAFLDWTGYDTLRALSDAGGLDSLFIEPNSANGAVATKSLTISTQHGETMPVEGRLLSVTWGGENALALMLYIAPPASQQIAAAAPQLQTDTEARELRAVLDTASDGVLVLDRGGRIVSANRSAEALFGYDHAELVTLPFAELFAPQSQTAALDYLDRMTKNGTAAVLTNQGSEVMGRVREGGVIPLFMTLGRIGDSGEKVCALFRDMTAWKKTEKELHKARREADKAMAAKTELIAKISHEIRTPLNAIIGFAQVMMDERFGPVGNERYRDYLRDIHGSGTQVMSMVNDLVDLSKIEAGKLELSFGNINLNDIVSQCVAVVQGDANRERIIIRMSLSPSLPQILADARAVRQIALNLLSNSIHLTSAGGQVIISTAMTDGGEAVLRVRDTSAGMSEQDLQTALEPFRQLPTSGSWGSGGTGLGLPLTKALAEANHATFKISSEVGSGTLVEIAFPSARVLAK
jgi:PAS domain S-box-containing protein